jgi:hypothetical protein
MHFYGIDFNEPLNYEREMWLLGAFLLENVVK